MFKEGQMVETLNGSHRGKVLEIDGNTVYIEQSNGVEMDFSLSDLQEYINPVEKNKLKVFLEQLDYVKKEGFLWKSLNTKEEFAKIAMKEQMCLLDGLEHLSNPAYYIPIIKMMNENQSNEEKLTFNEVEINKASFLQKVNIVLFLNDFQNFLKHLEREKHFNNLFLLGRMFNNLKM